MPSRRALSWIAALSALFAASSAGAASLLFRSSASYDSGGTDAAAAVAISSSRSVYVAGTAASKYFTIRYSTALAVISSAAFTDGGVDTVYGATTDSAGRVLVVGEGSNHLLLLKYSPTLSLLSSATLTVGIEDTPQAVAVDAFDNVFVAGTTFDGANFRILLAKFSPALALLAQQVWAPSPQSQGFGLAIDPAGSPIVVGQGLDAVWNVKIGKFSPTLAALTASASFNVPARDDQGRAVAVSSSGAVFVAAQTGPASAGVFDLLALRYDSSLTFVSSAAYDSGGDDRAQSAALDPSGNFYLSGFVAPGGKAYAMSIRYSPSLVALSSSTATAGLADKTFGSAVDVDGSLYAAGSSDNATTDFVVRRYAGPPVFLASLRAQQGGAGQVIDFTGDNFVSGAVLTVSDPGIVVNASNAASPARYVVNLDVAGATPLGQYDVKLVNPDGSTGTALGFFPVDKTVAIPAATGAVATANGVGGIIRVAVPAGSYAADITLTLSRPAAVPPAPGFITIGAPFQSTEAPALTLLPAKTVVIDAGYTLASLGGVNPAGLFLAYYDTIASAWTPMASTVDTVARVVTSTSTHLTLFQLMGQAATAPAAPTVGIFPNPYKPGSTGPNGDSAAGSGMVFTNLPADFNLRVFDAAGREVFSTSGHTNNGQYRWDTSTKLGGRAGSGVYVFRVLDAQGQGAGKGKFAIVR